MRKPLINKKRVLMIFFALLLVVGGGVVLIIKPIGESVIVDIFSTAATLVGTVFVAFELRNTQTVTCCDMLIQLNNYFHESETLMRVYTLLEEEHLGGNEASERFSSLHESDIAAYCTFFENLYLLVHNKIAKINDVDALFGYRFFLFLNNPYVQEHYILPTSSSYTQIFELYGIWMNYRDDEVKKYGKCRYVVGNAYRLSDTYVDRKLYLYDEGTESKTLDSFAVNGKDFTIRTISFPFLSDIIAMQATHTERTLYYPLTRNELIESMHLDTVLGVFSGGKLVGFCVILANRKTNRSLARDISEKDELVSSFDAVFIDKDFRGNRLQTRFIELAMKIAGDYGAKYIAATVSPENSFSLSNFEKSGFVKVKDTDKYGCAVRRIMKREI